MIEVKKLTLTYPSGKGVFELDFVVKQGEVVGYLGPNGAGKTTTIRALLGFMKVDSGSCTIGGMDCFKEAQTIQKTLGYIPGEMSFFNDMTGDEFLKFLLDLRGVHDEQRKNELIELFDLDPKGQIKKFSKGMKQKLGIISAFMHNPSVLILDEPTSGLDPIMQHRFIELIKTEKKKGHTILMSSHLFEEVEKTCDRVIIIKDGKIVVISDVHALKKAKRTGFVIETDETLKALNILGQHGFHPEKTEEGMIICYLLESEIDLFIKSLSRITIYSMHEVGQTLEEIFLKYYKTEGEIS
jgi:ABC-2 type transport system ATP-binding protein